MKKYIITVFISIGILFNIQSQVVYEHISNENIYLFLDELANEKWIEINSAIKPYSRSFIAEQLLVAQTYRSQMSSRQIKELEFYLQGFTLEIDDHIKLNPKI